MRIYLGMLRVQDHIKYGIIINYFLTYKYKVKKVSRAEGYDLPESIFS